MAIHIVDDQFFSINAVDMTPWLVSVDLTETAPLLDKTTQGDGNRTMKRGKKGYTADIVLQQDVAVASVDATIQAVLDADPAEETMIVKSKSSGGLTYTGEWTIGDYNSIPSGDGIAEISITIEAAGDIVKS